MAQKVVVTLIDDLDGDYDADETVAFGLDGVSYDIDLHSTHATELRDSLAKFVAAARRTGGRQRTGRLDLGPNTAAQTVIPTPTATPTRRRGAPATTDREQNQKVREWAGKQGLTVSKRGRIPADVSEAYQKYAPGDMPKLEDEVPTERAEMTLDLSEGDDITTGDDPSPALSVVPEDNDVSEVPLSILGDEDDESDPVAAVADVAQEVTSEDADPSEWGDTPGLLSKDQKKIIATWAHGQGMIDSASGSRVTRDLVSQYKALAARELADA